ncbi:Lhr family ATP-dependent helicase [Humibacter ginsenosidimutans]|uniref:DEAD/DEAH box helicase n=1 Tax=Humibacter ginsenosidimutans TaxID=2599293 RepID=A0A5B8M441_9MICO|nr:DEAD/DEAH box helicase [Humibacter ginsenosidimutans]QDZ15066.1 DEAD/DEAH box helicase [Humibacter ginsenosidimutans]
MSEVLERFSPATRAWFEGAFEAPTAAQLGAWDAISRGEHTLVIAPTGSGKTLASFLWAIDRLMHEAVEPGMLAGLEAPTGGTATGSKKTRGTRVLYISPLKALGVDVERNLRSPLVGITQTAKRLGTEPPRVTVGVRSGDTPANERRTLLTKPPDILITTPESLFLMLTSQARETLANVQTVIVDEVHAVAATKRGAHFAVSLERLDAMLPKPVQRVGLSATVRPPEEVARFLGGRNPVTIVAPASQKRFDLKVVVPVEDMRDVSPSAHDDDQSPQGGSIWPHVEEAIVDRVLEHRSSIVFANSRRLAERLTARMNEIYEERLSEAAAPFPEHVRRVDGPPVPLGRALDEVDARTGPRSRTPADLMGGSGQTRGSRAAASVDPFSVSTVMEERRQPREWTAGAGDEGGASSGILARAHHGSVSKEQRAVIEDDLKTGRLRCVVATSSLELGIDMGEVDLVVQVEAPPSVASGLQRVGRAGHQVGEVSKGVMFPKHRSDLINTAVASERMVAGLIEELRVPANPLDILAQQTIAATALDPVDVDGWFDTVRRSAPFATLPRSAFDATLDLVAGRYPSDEFAELRPRVVWDRDRGTLTARPGAQRLAVTSGGTIPDRGLFGVYMVGTDELNPAKGGRRVGELDEEMVYESRVGDVFALGATSWRIQEITHDRVLVTPAFGEPGRLPFWKGDGLGRPAELGEAVGGFVREVAAASEQEARGRASAAGLDAYATGNLLTYLDDQKKATGHLPTDRTLVAERFRDELGDWRLVLHSPYGMQVHAPWALAVAARVRERLNIDGSCIASDDGIVVRIPDAEAEPPGADLFVFEADELEQLVTDEVGGSALFASRFRECAARALLLPKYNPGKRSPLWQQRQKASQLLDVARKHPTFPIILETMRECLQDVYDLPALRRIAERIAARDIRIVEVGTEEASPFARSLLFGYVGAFMYEGDSPLAERRAAALAVDASLLSELLGRAELRELLDPAVIERVEREVQRLTPERRMFGLEGAADLLRLLGPLTVDEVVQRWSPERPADASSRGLRSDREADGSRNPEPGAGFETAAAPPPQPAEPFAADPAAARATLDELVAAKRALRVTIAGAEQYAAIEDSARLRDALGVPLPIGVPTAFIEPVDDPLGDLLGRYARTHGPFMVGDAASRFGLGAAVAHDTLRRLAQDRRITEGEFRPQASGTEWCDAEVLRRIRRLSLAALRHEVEPVMPTTFARFLPEWQHVGGGLRGVDAVASVIEQLAGTRIPASAWESLVLPARVSDYQPAMLDELTASGEVLWSGSGSLPGNDGWVGLHLADSAAFTMPPPLDHAMDELQREVLGALGAGGAFFFRQLADAVGSLDDAALATALWDLVWAGLITNDTFAPLRALTGGRGAHKPQRATPRARVRMPRAYGKPTMVEGLRAASARSGPPTTAGRWSILPLPETDATLRAKASAETLLDRYGVVTRGSVMAENQPGGFALAYRVLSGFEESGRARRGYFVETLGAAQFATSATVDRLRTFTLDGTLEPPRKAVALAATDPANPYGAALPWPQASAEVSATGHRPGRKAGAIVVLVDGALALYVERGGKTTLLFERDPEVMWPATRALADVIHRGRISTLTIETVGGEFVLGTPFGEALVAAGFAPTPRGLRLRS